MRIDLNASDTELLIEALDFSLASTGMLSPFTRKDRERAKAIKDNLEGNMKIPLLLEEQRKEFELEVSSSTAATLTEDEQMIRVVLNIGGRRFESTAEVLTKDRFSVLAALCTATPPVDPDTNGTYFFDRDGELFQHNRCCGR